MSPVKERLLGISGVTAVGTKGDGTGLLVVYVEYALVGVDVAKVMAVEFPETEYVCQVSGRFEAGNAELGS